MKTQTLTVDARFPEASVLQEAASVLQRGGLVAFPTETVYGLGACAEHEPALERLFAAKGRPTHHPLIAHVASEEQAQGLALEWNRCAARLACAFWPGPLTLVVPRASSVSPLLSGGGDSIAVRMPAHPVALGLLRVLGKPIAAPSANRYQALSPTAPEHVLHGLSGRIELLLAGGLCTAGVESTVVDTRCDPPCVLRPGALGVELLRTVEPHLEGQGVGEWVPSGASRPSPGMDARHYAPYARMCLAPNAVEVKRLAAMFAQEGKRVGVLLRGGSERVQHGMEYTLPDTPEAYAFHLFATLHALDLQRAEVVVVEAPPLEESWWAVRDRLQRGAT